MHNTTIRVDGTKLIIEVNLLGDAEPSSTGKTKLVGSTRGAVPVEVKGMPGLAGLKAAVNVTIPNK